MHERKLIRHNKCMKKTKFISISLFVLTMVAICALFPYPIFSKHTNVNSKQMSAINNYFETEITNEKEESPKLLNLNWQNQIDYLIDFETPYEVIDTKSQDKFFIIRIGGKNHADVVAYTTDDEMTIKKLYKQNWTCHPVLVKLNEKAYLPAAFYAYSHGYESHYCLHFKGSKTSGTRVTDDIAQYCVKKAKKSADIIINTL